MAEDAANRTEEPTPKRREEARADGRIPQSVEITVGDRAAGGAARDVAERRRGDRRSARVDAAEPARGLQARSHAGAARRRAARACCTTSATSWSRSCAATAVAGFVGDGRADRLAVPRQAPAARRSARCRRRAACSASSRARGSSTSLKAIVKIALVGWLSWKLIRSAEAQRHRALRRVAARDPRDRAAARWRGWSAWVDRRRSSCSPPLDYAWQRRQHQQSLRMSRQRGEGRGAAGGRRSQDQGALEARVPGARRSAACSPTCRRPTSSSPTRSTSRSRSRYAPGRDGRAAVVAKGAERHGRSGSRTSRAQHGVPIVERRALARALFRSVPVGGEIPATLYRAVAEILAYIYGLRAAAGRVTERWPMAHGAASSEGRHGTRARRRRARRSRSRFVVVVIVMIIPLPTVLLDLLLRVNIALVADHPAGRDVHAEAARVLDLPVGAAGDDAASACR